MITNERLPIDRLLRSSAISRDMGEAELEVHKIKIGERLIEVFGTDNLSEIGRQLDMSATNVKRYITGARPPSHEVEVRLIARGISLDWLYTGNGSKWRKKDDLFSNDEIKKISDLALENGISFWEQVHRLTSAGLSFLEEINKTSE